MTACFITYFEMSMRPKTLAVVDLNLQISAGQAHSHTKKTGCLALNFFLSSVGFSWPKKKC